MMTKERKAELVQRSLGIRHKLKVHESGKLPDSHEEIALMMLVKWELEDELHAIEQILAESRHDNVATKRNLIENENIQLVRKKVYDTPPPSKKKK
jgi:hypothetical protein